MTNGQLRRHPETCRNSIPHLPATSQSHGREGLVGVTDKEEGTASRRRSTAMPAPIAARARPSAVNPSRNRREGRPERSALAVRLFGIFPRSAGQSAGFRLSRLPTMIQCLEGAVAPARCRARSEAPRGGSPARPLLCPPDDTRDPVASDRASTSCRVLRPPHRP